MAVFSKKVVINQRVEAVFAYLNDQQNHAQLNPHNFRDFKVTSTSRIGVGAQARFMLKTGAFHEQVIISVTKSEPPTLLIEEGVLKDATFQVSWHLTSLAARQTELMLTCEYNVSGTVGLFGGLIEKAFVRIYARVLDNLSQQLALASA